MVRDPDTRYCARGETCTQYAFLGEPEKLSRYNLEPICGRCSQEEKSKPEGKIPGNGSRQAKGSAMAPAKQTDTHKRPEGSEVLGSDTGARLRKLKRDLVLQLFTKQGPFWEAVRDVRARQGITAVAQLPPSTPGPPLPEAVPDYYTEQEAWVEFQVRWQTDVYEIQQQAMPEKYRDIDQLRPWFKFLAACVLYDPPATDLLEFAAYADPTPTTIHQDRFDDDDYAELPHMLDPPIKTIHDLSKMRDRLWGYAIQEILERLSEKRGEHGDVGHMVAAAERCVEEFAEEQGEASYEGAEPYYIEVDEHTTLEDVKRAFKVISATQERRRSGSRPKRDRLTAVECAALRESDLKYWTFKRLADRYGWKGKDAVRDHLKIGLEVLKEIPR